MNKTVLYFIIIAFISIGFAENTKAQCKQQVVYSCATNITVITKTGERSTAIYLKDFNTKLRRGRGGESSGTQWAVVLNKGTVYRFNLCTQSGFEKDVVLTLYDNRHQEFVKPHAITKKEKKNRFDFYCCKSATYYVSIRFKKGRESKKSCAVGVLSFVRKFNAKKHCGNK